jgi:catechol 2,3-dioxygenase-like lactoylglutathione lyase family enzyme
MEQRLSVITLGVKNFQKSLDFYTQVLNWVPSSASNDNISFFQIGGIVFSLYPQDLLAQDACIEKASNGFAGITFSHNVKTKEEVKHILDQVQQRGGYLLKPAQEAFWGGYSGYFSDPDGYVFEVAWNPFWELKEGEVKLP